MLSGCVMGKRDNDIPGRRLTWEWKLGFTVVVAVILFAVFAVLA